MLDDCTLSENILKAVTAWAKGQAEVRGVALVGSRARGTTRPTSDVDLVLLVTDPEAFRTSRCWLHAIDWSMTGVQPLTTQDAQYGVVWSRHVATDQQLEVEFSFAPLSWAICSPVDTGTKDVILGGCRVLYDPDALLTTLENNLGKH